MMPTWCMRVCGLNSLVDYFNDKIHDILGGCDIKVNIVDFWVYTFREQIWAWN
jgi:hypothetical protein